VNKNREPGRVPDAVMAQAKAIHSRLRYYSGNCARASFRLYTWCRENGYRASFVLGIRYTGDHDQLPEINHAWVTLDGWIIDVTDTQFTDKMDVSLWPQSYKMYRAFYRDRRALRRVYDRWSRDEQPVGLGDFLKAA
jgi:hypothetical protein